VSAEHRDPSWRVRVDPHGFEFDCRDGDNVMAAATRAGYVWPTACGGTEHCAVCWTKVLDGLGHLDDPSPVEVGPLQTLAARRRHGDSVRLACQAGVRGDLVVHKSGVRPRDASDAAPAALAPRL
jgi:ferredoxin